MTDHADSMLGSENQGEGDQDLQSELYAFSQVVSAFQPLSSVSRAKVLRTVATFFGVAAPDAPTKSVAATALQFGGSGAPSPGTAPSFSEDRTPSPKAFLLEKRPVTDIERIACLAYYLTHYRDTSRFKTIDLSVLNTEAAQSKFSNAADSVKNATTAGFLVQAPQGAKQISAMGELYVQALPDREAAREAIAHFRAGRRSRRGRKTSNSGGETTGRGSATNGNDDDE